jgi:cytochrome oxidase Cu insertion factor (SCO1/SenC/PrrC family)
VLAGGALALDHDAAGVRVTGELVARQVPLLPLRNEHGRRTSLAALRGKVVVLTPFLTLCHEVCPLTTGAFEAMQRAVDQAGLGDRVVFAEVSVDPWRDTPARLRAFARLTGVHFELFTGSRRELLRFWHFFGVAYYRTPEGRPPDRDWMTGRPLRFDVSHTDGLFLVDPRGVERIVDVGMPSVRGRLSRTMRRLLNSQGLQNLAHPGPGWSVRQGLDDVGFLLRRRLSPARS